MKDVKWNVNACLVLALFGLSGCKFEGMRWGLGPVLSTDSGMPPVIVIEPIQPESKIVRVELKDEANLTEVTVECPMDKPLLECFQEERVIDGDRAERDPGSLIARVVEGEVRFIREEKQERSEGDLNSKDRENRVDLRYVAPVSKELRLVMGEKIVDDDQKTDVLPDDKGDAEPDQIDPKADEEVKDVFGADVLDAKDVFGADVLDAKDVLDTDVLDAKDVLGADALDAKDALDATDIKGEEIDIPSAEDQRAAEERLAAEEAILRG